MADSVNNIASCRFVEISGLVATDSGLAQQQQRGEEVAREKHEKGENEVKEG